MMLASVGGAVVLVVVIIVLVAAGLVVYFLPSYIARSRHHHNLRGVFVLNLVLGWTLLGWIAAMFWAFINPPSLPNTQSASLVDVQEQAQ